MEEERRRRRGRVPGRGGDPIRSGGLGPRFYNTLTRRIEPLEPLRPGEVRMYNCGPTVYQAPSIGNYRAFLFADILRRTLEARGLRVLQVMNLTDVGHLTIDAEERGEDKLEKAARETGMDPWAISRKWTEKFFEDLRVLRVRSAHHYPKATDHIPEMLEMIEGLVAKGYAYVVGENVYYDVTKFEGYGRLSGNRIEDLDAGARIEPNPEKRHPADFALWKSDPKHRMKWPSRFGPNGFPGWHIECSAMSRKLLGEAFDIHTGGEDNVFPHHESEIAQSEAYHGVRFVRLWMHTKFLLVDGRKMSKSLGNVVLVGDVLERGFPGKALRYALTRVHYRQPLNFTWDGMKDATASLERLQALVAHLRQAERSGEAGTGAPAGEAEGEKVARAARERFDAALDDDLNASEALAALFDFATEVHRHRWNAAGARPLLAFLAAANEILDVLDLEEEILPEEVERKIAEREAARAARDFKRSDAIRDELRARGVLLEDTPQGVRWRRGSGSVSAGNGA